MKNRKQKDAPPATPRHETVTPFFARYLEGQEPEPDAEASVGAPGGRAEFTYGGARKTSAKKSAAKKSAAKKSAARKSAGKGSQAARSSKGSKATRAPGVTLKYPSDNDELVFFPYKAEAIELTQGLRVTRKFPSDVDEPTAVTLKYPSDDDEVGYYPAYASSAEVPKGEAKPKEGRVRLSRKRPR